MRSNRNLLRRRSDQRFVVAGAEPVADDLCRCRTCQECICGVVGSHATTVWMREASEDGQFVALAFERFKCLRELIFAPFALGEPSPVSVFVIRWWQGDTEAEVQSADSARGLFRATRTRTCIGHAFQPGESERYAGAHQEGTSIQMPRFVCHVKVSFVLCSLRLERFA